MINNSSAEVAMCSFLSWDVKFLTEDKIFVA